jgi:hypothetical protein
MKLIRVLGVAACLFLSAETTLAQENPAISKEYSNEEIARMVRTYKRAHSHDVMPPEMIQQKFRVDFPKAHDVEWETDGKIYEVEFEIKFRDCQAYYDAKGNLLMYVKEIYRSELPAIVKNAVENKYPKYRFDDIDKIWRGTEVFYKIEVENKSSDTEIKLLLKEDGTIFEEKFDY